MKHDKAVSDFIEKCKGIDFSARSMGKDKNLEKLKKIANEYQMEGDVEMKKARKPLVLILAAVLLLTATVSVFADDIVNAVRRHNVGDVHVFILHDDWEEENIRTLPDSLRGRLFDADGNEAVYFVSGVTSLFEGDGNEVLAFFLGDIAPGDILIPGQIQLPGAEFYIPRLYWSDEGVYWVTSLETFVYSTEYMFRTVFDLDEALGSFIGDIRVPAYLPEGMSFAFATLRNWHTVTTSAPTTVIQDDAAAFMVIVYYDEVNDRSFTLSAQRRGRIDRAARDRFNFMTHHEGIDAEIIEKSINGHRAIVLGEMPILFIEINNTLYTFSTDVGDRMSIEEMIRMAESM